MCSLGLVERDTPGLTISSGFDGLGLRGNDSCPVTASQVRVSRTHRLGGDGEGFGIMMQTVLPLFSVLISAGSIAFMEAALTATCEHAGGLRYEHAGSKLADLPTIRAYIARMRIETDKTRALWLDTLDALERGTRRCTRGARRALRVAAFRIDSSYGAVQRTSIAGGGALSPGAHVAMGPRDRDSVERAAYASSGKRDCISPGAHLPDRERDGGAAGARACDRDLRQGSPQTQRT